MIGKEKQEQAHGNSNRNKAEREHTTHNDREFSDYLAGLGKDECSGVEGYRRRRNSAVRELALLAWNRELWGKRLKTRSAETDNRNAECLRVYTWTTRKLAAEYSTIVVSEVLTRS